MKVTNRMDKDDVPPAAVSRLHLGVPLRPEIGLWQT